MLPGEWTEGGKSLRVHGGKGASGHWGLQFELMKEPGNQIFDELYELQVEGRYKVGQGGWSWEEISRRLSGVELRLRWPPLTPDP